MSTTPVAELTPAQVGVGMRISIHPHADDYESIILGALQDVAENPVTQRLSIETETVSTYVGATQAPAAQDLAAYATDLIAAASRRSGRRHLVAHLLFSRGCPGQATCELTPGNLPAEETVLLEPTGVPAVVGWSLYPLDDSGAAHMDAIQGAIEESARADVDVRGLHYATELRGDLAAVLAVVVNTWAAVGRTIGHVVTHVSVSLDSPSEPGGPREPGGDTSQ